MSVKTIIQNHKNLSAHDYLQKTLLAPIYNIVKQTPLDHLTVLSKKLGCHVFLKREDLQIVHSFKIRGAHNCMIHLRSDQKQKGVIAASAGNHAQGVALSAKTLELNAQIIMPKTSPEIKINAVKQLGAEIILYGDRFDQANQKALEIAEKTGKCFIPPFEHPDIIAGQGTIALEMSQQQNDLNLIFVPVGGGGLISGIASYYKSLLPHVKIIGVEPEHAASMTKAFKAGAPIILDQIGLFADGVAVKCVGEETFRLAHHYVDDMITVSNDEICAAIKDIFEDTRAISEPSGALSIAGMKAFLSQNKKPDWFENMDLKHLKIAGILSGANVNFHSLRYISERCSLGEQREAVIAVKIPEKTDSFKHFVHSLGGYAVTEFNYRYADPDQALVLVGIQLSDGQNINGALTSLQASGYQAWDLSNDETAKMHVRYMVGGQPNHSFSEYIYSFQFPEHKGALSKFLTLLNGRWNISLFHYRHHGLLFGRVLIGFQIKNPNEKTFQNFLKECGMVYKRETHSIAYKLFLKK